MSKPYTTDVRFFPSLKDAVEHARSIRQHEPSPQCWCFPELIEIDEDGREWWKHHYEM